MNGSHVLTILLSLATRPNGC